MNIKHTDADWVLTHKGKKCTAVIDYDDKDNLNDCIRYCETYDIKRLNYNKKGYCRCCTPSSDLSASTDSELEVYTLGGNQNKSLRYRYFLNSSIKYLSEAF